MSYEQRLRRVLDRVPPPTLDELLARGAELVRRESEPHRVTEGGTPEDAEYWRRRHALRRVSPE